MSDQLHLKQFGNRQDVISTICMLFAAPQKTSSRAWCFVQQSPIRVANHPEYFLTVRNLLVPSRKWRLAFPDSTLFRKEWSQCCLLLYCSLVSIAISQLCDLWLQRPSVFPLFYSNNQYCRTFQTLEWFLSLSHLCDPIHACNRRNSILMLLMDGPMVHLHICIFSCYSSTQSSLKMAYFNCVTQSLESVSWFTSPTSYRSVSFSLSPFHTCLFITSLPSASLLIPSSVPELKLLSFTDPSHQCLRILHKSDRVHGLSPFFDFLCWTLSF